MIDISRRAALAGLVSFGGAALLSGPLRAEAAAGAPAEDLIAASKLSGDVAYAVIDLASGRVVEAREADRAMPPASTAKTITTLYALDELGPDYRFRTRLIATGPVSGGVVQGNLILAGGADPTLTTDDLGDMAAALARRGVRGVTGQFLVWGGAIPYAEDIADDQPVHVGYNPGISGLNLNYNRVYVEWGKAKGGMAMTVDARGARYVPKVSSADVAAVNRAAPLFTYNRASGKEHWTIAASALTSPGSRWLPVRDPAGYAGDVFRTLAAAQGVTLPAANRAGAPGDGAVLAEHVSDPLSDVLRDMLKHSTNLTAETVGMATSEARGLPAAKGASGAAMSAWLAQTVGGTQARFVDHSGLNAETRISPLDMARAVAALGGREGLRPLLKPFPLRDAQGRWIDNPPFRVDAKTGTLNFVSTLTGYLTAPGGRDLVFAVFTANTRLRDQSGGQENAPGVKPWVARSKVLQSQLLDRWARLYS